MRFLDEFWRELGPIFCFLLVIAFIAAVAFLASVTRALERVDPENRRMEPALVWLNLIPIFNLLWIVVTVERVGESIRNEFVARGRHKKTESYGKTAGLAAIALWYIGIPFASAFTPVCIVVFWFFAFMYWVVYWAQISGYARRFKSDGGSYAPPQDEGW